MVAPVRFVGSALGPPDYWVRLGEACNWRFMDRLPALGLSVVARWCGEKVAVGSGGAIGHDLVVVLVGLIGPLRF